MSGRDRDIQIIGADANNLKHIDLTLPRRGVTMIVGVSGSGKSSLLSATLAAEGEHRLRTFLGIPQIGESPHDVRAFVGALPPTLHVGQRTFRASVRTTVATSTGLLSLLRRLFIECSSPWSQAARAEVPAPNAPEYAGWLLAHHRAKVTVWAVPVRVEQTDGVRAVERLRRAGVSELMIWDPPTGEKEPRGRRVGVQKFRPLSTNVPHTIEAEIAKLDLSKPGASSKVRTALEQAFIAGNGRVVVELHGSSHPDVQSDFGPRLDSTTDWVIVADERVYAPASRSLLSFNSPGQPESGACPQCAGTGRAVTVREDLLVVHPGKSMHEGAFALWTSKNYKHVNIQHETIEGLRGMRGFSPDTPWKRLSADARQLVLDGTDELVTDRERKTGRKMSAPRRYDGFRKAIRTRVSKGGKSAAVLAQLVDEGACPSCGGTRWSHQARALRVGKLGIHDLLALEFDDLAEQTREPGQLARAATSKARAVVSAVCDQARAFVSVGLSHLSGDRGMLDVSEGESRRTRLAGVLNARETGLLALLDEPARGLHDVDLASMAGALRELGRNHTVILNEHRVGLVGAASRIVELGPGAGPSGGTIVFSGAPKGSRWNAPAPLERRQHAVDKKTQMLTIRGATLHNIDDASVSIPLGRLTCLTGVSGSGKSNFARGVLVPAIARGLDTVVAREDFDTRPGRWSAVSGDKSIKGLVALDHKPPPPNRRSTVATFLGVADALRKAFAATASARAGGLTTRDFGLNSGEGRCPACLGVGETDEEGLPSTCAGCAGSGYSQAALAPLVDGLNIRDTLGEPISELRVGATWLGDARAVLDAMHELGIGHIALGRRVDTMSGGEVQRLRIAQRLAEHATGGLLFVLDEPAAGLHHEDVRRLLDALDRILDHGRNTVVLVEHNLALIRASDWVIEFGPGTGREGGRVVASGVPRAIAKSKTATGQALRGGSKTRSRVTRVASPPSRAPIRGSSEMARRVVSSIRRLRGDDVGASETDTAAGTDRGMVVLDAAFVADRRVHEIADLDLELATVLLEDWTAAQDTVADMAAEWRRHGGWLAIQPFLGDLQTWSDPLPQSVARDLERRLQTSGLRVVDLSGQGLGRVSTDWQRTRATRADLLAPPGTSTESAAKVSVALGLGGGYLELRGRRGDLARAWSPRIFDEERGVVAPFAPSSERFSRLHRRGQCPACDGCGTVAKADDQLVIRSARARPTDDTFLTAQATKLLKGLVRHELQPLLRKLETEGLWTSGARYADLSAREKHILLYGCWNRPGHGTFVRNAKADPAEVGAWLRWDGVYRHLWAELGRSNDAAWRERVEASRRSVSCPICAGTGHHRNACALSLANEPLATFIAKRTVRELDRALDALPARSKRQRMRIARLRRCFEPAVRSFPKLRLQSTPDTELALRVAERCVQEFTDMPFLRT